jgi:hypothetical protein
MRLLRTVEVGAKRISWAASRQVAAFLDPPAIAFYEQLRDSRCEPDHLLKALPTHKLIIHHRAKGRLDPNPNDIAPGGR